MQHSPGAPTTTRPPLTRRSQHKLVAGVASGLGDHFHIDPNLVRLAFVVLTLAGGAGLVLYAAGWLFLPTQAEVATLARHGPATTSSRCSRSARSRSGCCCFAQSIGLGFGDALLWPVVLAAMGTALIVGRSGRPIDELIGELVRRERGLTGSSTTRTEPADTSSVLRIVLGGALVVAGVGAFLATQGAFRAVGQGLLAVAVMLGGLGLIFGPWLWRLWTALVTERSERIRSDERAEMAAHLHDSVLQTLALIQRRADDPRAVVGLARAPGARAARLAVRPCAGRRRARPRRRARRGRRRRRGSTRASRSRRCASAVRARSTTVCVRSWPRAERRSSTRHATRASPSGRRLRRGRGRPGHRVRARPRPRLRPDAVAHRPGRDRRVDHRPHAPQRRTRRDPVAPGPGHRGRAARCRASVQQPA